MFPNYVICEDCRLSYLFSMLKLFHFPNMAYISLWGNLFHIPILLWNIALFSVI